MAEAGNPNSSKPVLVTGATGYIGGRLVPRLIERGYRVRCLVRSPRKLEARPWAQSERVEIVEGDLSEPEGLAEAITGCGVGFYLVHSMLAAGDDFADRDRRLAKNFATAAGEAGLEQIVYLGGLGEMGPELSEHLRSRREVEHVLAGGGVPVTTLRAAVILGSGSASFEVLRYLVERLPVMVTPRWVRTECQPIAVRDVLGYLTGVIGRPEAVGRSFDIGGPEVHEYLELMRLMQRALKLPRRLILPVPILTPKLSAYWIHLVTPISSRIARPLAEGMRNRVVARENDIRGIVPQELIPAERAIELALARVEAQDVETIWSAAGVIEGDPDWAGGTVYEDITEIEIDADAHSVFRAVQRVGGGHGWYALDWLWQIRGWMDRLVGGPGLRRGRRDPETVGYGEALDFWRVVEFEQDRRLGLRAEMKVPGEALLRFDVTPKDDGGGSILKQTALFRPKGLLGLAYWYAVLPLHGPVFRGMTRGICRAAEKLAAESQPDQSQHDEARPADA
ncbi:MAG: SDR family oxidoreductase [Planctomycetota bacterium]